MRREHVEHFIETLDDRDLADQLALLRIPDADALEDTLRARQRAKARQGKAAFGSSKYRQKAPTPPDAVKSAPTRKLHAVRTTADSGSELCIFAYVEKQSKVSEREDLIDNTCELHGKRTAVMANLRMPDEFARVDVIMALDLLPGESRGYWKYHAPGKWFKQAKAVGKIDNEKADLLFDSGAEASILDAASARKVGCYIDESQKQECVGIGENVYVTDGRTKIKVTLAGSLVYFFEVWVGAMSGQDAILGMDFMMPAGKTWPTERSACRMRFASSCQEGDRFTEATYGM
ncbi:unnamed protein product [Phytophthora lilii]|uniref:Unnamed protein product n=1 Tax=Phytophthora lilii TaxID=2077276 RepID=A0A9W6UBN0_9STRA|nr:unnamed protein product [Phytophthora lilii]